MIQSLFFHLSNRGSRLTLGSSHTLSILDRLDLHSWVFREHNVSRSSPHQEYADKNKHRLDLES